MSKKRKWLSTLLIVLGLLIAAYPIIDNIRIKYWENRLLEAFEEDVDLEIVASGMVESDYLALQAIYENENIIENDNSTTNEDTQSTETTEANSTSNTETTNAVVSKPDKSVIGKLKISKIDLVMPILYGATEKNLNRGATVIAGTSDFGEIGNVGIAGHRGRSYGIWVNRLNELKEGDIIEITTNNTIYKYTVYKVHIVEPTDVSVLNKNDSDKILTLVTCDPIRNPTHRLIVHALQNP